jgi:hypothetical protein
VRQMSCSSCPAKIITPCWLNRWISFSTKV